MRTELIDQHGPDRIDRKAGGQTANRIEHYTDGGTPVRITIHDDRSYGFQSYATVERWTNGNGYQPVATLDPEVVHQASFPGNRGLADLADELRFTYERIHDGGQK